MFKRLLPLLIAFSGAAAANQAEVSVIVGRNEPVVFNVPLDGELHAMDLRDSHSYSAAFTDPATKREICRDGEYKTGLVLSLRSLPNEGDDQPLEVVGMVTTLTSITNGAALKCGINQEVKLANRSLSEMLRLVPNKTKPMVIDGKWTVLVRLKP
ncbi:TPA: hypothetical protein ACP32N_003147 [Pseudomonas aeruginosa]